MKWGIFILLWFISFSVFSQWLPKINRSTWEIDHIYNTNDNIVYIGKKGDIIINDGNYISGGDNSLVLWFDSKNVTKSGLTYNSTGDTIVWASNDTVVVDSTDNIVIGNSIRFGDPESGTIYTILDTLGSIDSIKLDQICTGNIGDEFYIGCDGLIIDQSSYGNDGIQTTGAYQPKGIWIETDSSCWYFDGIDDTWICSNFKNIEVSSSISIFLYIRILSTNRQGLFHNGASSAGLSLFIGTNLTNIASYVYTGGGANSETCSSIPIIESKWFFIGKYTSVSNRMIIINNNFECVKTPIGYIHNSANLNVISTPFGKFKGYVDEIRIYKKILTEDEITQLYESSKHYSE